MNADRRVLKRVGNLLALLLLAFTLANHGAPASADVGPSAAAPGVSTRLEGYLRAIGANKWLIDDRGVLVDAQTLLVEKRGKAEVGAWVIVWGTRDESGSVYAELIQVDRPAGRTGIELQFTGVIRKITGSWWVIEQNLVEVTGATTFIGEPRLGSLVWAIAEQRGDAFRATVIRSITADPSVPPVEFEGIIESFDAQMWEVDGHRLVIAPDTVIIGEPKIGEKAEVRAQPSADADLIARMLRVVDRASQAQLSAMVTAIAPNRDGSETWEVLIFPKTTDETPVTSELQITSNTFVDESRAIAQSGQWVEVAGLKIEGNAYQADVIRLEQPTPIVLEGNLTPLSTKPGARGWWLLNGQPVWWLPSGASAAASLGDERVSVSGVRLGNGVIWVKQIRETQSPAR